LGNTNEGTQAPPTITSNNVAKMAMPRVAAALRPMAANIRPNAAFNTHNATASTAKPMKLPPMRTLKIAIAAV
jgi:hypothetical protein